MKAFFVIGRTIKAVYEELFLCVFMSIAWWIGMVLVVPAAPVTAAMHHVCNRTANYKRVNHGFYWDAFKQRFGRGWLVYLLHLLAPLLVVFQIWFYFNGNAPSWMMVIGVAWAWLFVLIVMLIQYIFPLFWQQDEPQIGLILRNAFLLTLRHPLYTFIILVFQILFFALSFVLVLPLILLAPAAMAMTVNFALTGLLQEMDLAPEPPVIP